MPKLPKYNLLKHFKPQEEKRQIIKSFHQKSLRQTVVTDKVCTQYILFGMEELKPNNSCHFRNVI